MINYLRWEPLRVAINLVIMLKILIINLVIMLKILVNANNIQLYLRFRYMYTTATVVQDIDNHILRFSKDIYVFFSNPMLFCYLWATVRRDMFLYSMENGCLTLTDKWMIFVSLRVLKAGWNPLRLCLIFIIAQKLNLIALLLSHVDF